MKRALYGVLASICYVVLYWVAITVWSLTGFATIGKIAAFIDIILRAAAIPFLAGTAIAFALRERLQMWGLFLAPFAWSAILLIVQDVDWHAMPNGVLGFWVISSMASCAAVAGAVAERKSTLGN